MSGAPQVQFQLPPTSPGGAALPPSFLPSAGGSAAFQPPSLNQLGLGGILPGSRTPATVDNTNFLSKIANTGSQIFADVGLTHPVQRFALGMFIGGGLEYMIRPSVSYNPDGSPKSWAVISGQSGKGETYLPAGSTGLITGLLFATFF